jgi:hypothetical protein
MIQTDTCLEVQALHRVPLPDRYHVATPPTADSNPQNAEECDTVWLLLEQRASLLLLTLFLFRKFFSS